MAHYLDLSNKINFLTCMLGTWTDAQVLGKIQELLVDNLKGTGYRPLKATINEDRTLNIRVLAFDNGDIINIKSGKLFLSYWNDLTIEKDGIVVKGDFYGIYLMIMKYLEETKESNTVYVVDLPSGDEMIKVKLSGKDDLSDEEIYSLAIKDAENNGHIINKSTKPLWKDLFEMLSTIQVGNYYVANATYRKEAV
jgi:hypothetical protein